MLAGGTPDNYRVLRNNLVTTVAVTVAMSVSVSVSATVTPANEDVDRVGVQGVCGGTRKPDGVNLRSHNDGSER